MAFLGKYKIYQPVDFGTTIDPNYVIQTSLDSQVFDDITSLENFDNVIGRISGTVGYYSNIRNEMSLLIDNFGGFLDLSTAEQEIVSRHFLVSKADRDTIHTSDEQIANAKRIQALLAKENEDAGYNYNAVVYADSNLIADVTDYQSIDYLYTPHLTVGSISFGASGPTGGSDLYATISTKVDTTDNRLHYQNVLKVKKNPGVGEYSSINAALAAITDNSTTNRYSITVYPGKYTESTIYTKPFVEISGIANFNTIIEVNDYTKDVVVLCPNTSFNNFLLTGATATGAAAFAVTASFGPGASCEINNISFLTVNTIFRSALSVGQFAIVGFLNSNVSTFSNVKKGIDISGAGYTILSWANSKNSVVSTISDFAELRGSNNRLIFTDFGLITQPALGGTMSNFVRIYDGATIDLVGVSIDGAGTALNNENTGSGVNIRANGFNIINSLTSDVVIGHPSTVGNLQGIVDSSKVTIDSTNFRLSYSEPTGGFVITGDFTLGQSQGTLVEMGAIIERALTMGVYEGGDIATVSASGFTVSVEAGFGYLCDDGEADHTIRKIFWDNDSIAVSPYTSEFLYYNSSGTLLKSATRLESQHYIFLGRTVTDSSSIVSIIPSKLYGMHYSNDVDTLLRDGFGSIYKSGSLVSEGTSDRTLDVTSGVYYNTQYKYTPSGGLPITFDAFYKNGSGGFTISRNQQVLPNSTYDNGSGTLVSATAGYYMKFALYVVGDGANEKYFIVHPQEQHLTQLAAEQGSIPIAPSYFDASITLIASIVVQQGNSSIVSIFDNRPTLSFKAESVTALSTHGNLAGLLEDDHPQYLLGNGTRAMSGNLNLGNNNITNVANINGISIATHSSRHLPNGADPLTTGTPSTVGTSNQEGIGNAFSRQDHVHAHGFQTNELHHALSTTVSHGFMSSVDKYKLDYIPGSSASYFSEPLYVNGLTVSVFQATSTQSGYLSTTDWNTFNNKQSTLTFTNGLTTSSGTISLTTTGVSSGSYTFSNVTVDQYGRLTSVSNGSQATSTQSGYLSTTDWNTFNNKLGTSLTSSYILVGNGSNVAVGATVSGDATLSNTGVLTLNSSVVNDSKIASHTSTKITITNKSQLNTSVVYSDQGNTFSVAKQSFQSDGTYAPIKLGGLASDPSSLEAGDFWYNSADPSLKFRTGSNTTRIVVDTRLSQTLYNKTLESPMIATISNGGGSISVPSISVIDTMVLRNTAETLTNKTLTGPTISYIYNTGTVTLPTSTDTLVGRNTTDTLTNKTLTGPTISTIYNTGTLTLPTTTDTLVGRATSDVLTNKTISASGNTISDASIATGDLLKSNGSKFVRFGMGSPLQVLRVNAGGTDLEYANPSAGSGTVTSVGMTTSGVLYNVNTTITTSGTFSLTLLTQNANLIFAGPSTGGATTPSFRSLVTADMPSTVVLNNQSNTITNTANTSVLSLVSSNASFTGDALTVNVSGNSVSPYNLFKLTSTLSGTSTDKLVVSKEGMLRVHVGTASMITAPTYSIAHFVSNIGASASVIVTDTYGTIGAGYMGRRARGTSDAPTAVQTNDILTSFIGRGYGATNMNTSDGYIRIVASQNFTDTAHGTYISFYTTGTSSIVASEKMRIGDDGTITLTTALPITSGGTGQITPNDALNALFLSATASGTDTYTVTLTGITSITTGTIIRIGFTNANTSTATLNVNSLGAIAIVKEGGIALRASDIGPGSIHHLMYDGVSWTIVASSMTLKSIVFFSPSQVTSGTAFTLTLVSNDRVVRTLSGSNVTNTSYTEIALPADFISFPTGAYRVDSNRSGNGTLTVTIGKGGVADATMNALSLVATATNSTWETKSGTPTSSYTAGDRLLITMTTTTSGNTTTAVGNVILQYYGR
jgi:hypothetical protein